MGCQFSYAVGRRRDLSSGFVIHSTRVALKIYGIGPRTVRPDGRRHRPCGAPCNTIFVRIHTPRYVYDVRDADRMHTNLPLAGIF